MNIRYITSNPHKIESANRNLSPFNITIEGIKLENIQEIQTDNIEEISINKAKQAYSQINKPLIVSDSGWSIPALNGFPGPLMAYVNRWFTSEDFLNLIRSKENKEIVLIECITYIDKDNIETFKQETKGRFLDKEDGEGTSLDKVITFREDNKSVARCQNDNISGINQIDMWNDLGRYLNSSKS